MNHRTVILWLLYWNVLIRAVIQSANLQNSKPACLVFTLGYIWHRFIQTGLLKIGISPECVSMSPLQTQIPVLCWDDGNLLWSSVVVAHLPDCFFFLCCAFKAAFQYGCQKYQFKSLSMQSLTTLFCLSSTRYFCSQNCNSLVLEPFRVNIRNCCVSVVSEIYKPGQLAPKPMPW